MPGGEEYLLLAGYVYATAQTLAHVDVDAQISPAGLTIPSLPSSVEFVHGDCSAAPRVSLQLLVGVDNATTGIGLAAALNVSIGGYQLPGWNVSQKDSYSAQYLVVAVL